MASQLPYDGTEAAMILVTGATGTVGSETVRALAAKGAKFRVGARDPGKAKAKLPAGADAVAFDLDQPGTFDAALRGVERLFLLSPGVPNQVEQATALVAAAKQAGVKHVVKLSVIGADQEPGINFGRLHRAAEKVISQSGLGWTFLRPTFFIQNFVHYYGVNPKQDSTVYLPHGTGKTSWLDAQDIGDAAAAALTATGHEGKIYDLTGPEALSDAEVCAILSAALNKKITYVDVPESAARSAMADMKMPPFVLEGTMELSAIIKAGYTAGIAPGVKQATGHDPRTVRDWAKQLAATVR
jgi:uncharacterized protein YbjT (DUF2867 family)